MVMLLRNVAGKSPASSPVCITVDNTALVITSPANNEIQVGTPVTIGGTGNEPEFTIQLYYNGQVMTDTPTIVGSHGKWSSQVTLTQGFYGNYGTKGFSRPFHDSCFKTEALICCCFIIMKVRFIIMKYMSG